MRVLIFHGYLLRGTGSNIYTASLAQALAKAGHEVHVCCQDLDALELPWVAGVGRWHRGRLVIEGEPPQAGAVTAYLPPIGEILPVYVEDSYPGFDARAFGRLSADEIDAYIQRNRDAVAEISDHAGGVDATVTNHLIMGPVICARAGLRFAAKMHGSDMSYTITPEPERFMPYAREGLEAANAILVGSEHIAEQLVDLSAERSLLERTYLGPPGVDTDLFHPVPAPSRRAILEGLADRLAQAAPGPFGREPVKAAAALSELAAAEGARVLFVGKLLEQKGIRLLLEGWRAVHEAVPGARLCIAGFGELEGEVEAAARQSGGSIVFTGRLEHEEVAELTGCADVQVVPSTFPEAFGMVAAEAAASGVLALCADHSGLGEVSRATSESLPQQLGELTRFRLGPDAVGDLTRNLIELLRLDQPARERAGRLAREVCAERWGWAPIAEAVIAAARGEQSRLRQVGE